MDQLCLKWNNFFTNFSDQLRQLKKDEDYVDVTLVTEDGEEIKAHKLILAMCSPFFKKVLSSKNHPHPLLYMKGVDYSTLSYLTSFINDGEVNVPQEGLENFLAVAKELKIKGLINDSLEKKDIFIEEDIFGEDKEAAEDSDTFSESFNDRKEDISYLFPKPNDDIKDFSSLVSTNPNLKKIENPVMNFSNLEEIEEELIEKRNGFWHCKRCGKITSSKYNIKSHIETHVEGVSYPCDHCGKLFRSRNSVRKHISVKHREQHWKTVVKKDNKVN